MTASFGATNTTPRPLVPTDRVMALLQQEPAVQYLNISTPGKTDIRTTRSPGLHDTAQHVKRLIEKRFDAVQHPAMQVHLGFESFQIYHSRYGYTSATLICSIGQQGDNDWRESLDALLHENMENDDLSPQMQLTSEHIQTMKQLIRPSLGPLAARAVNKILKNRNLEPGTRFNTTYLPELIDELTELASPSDRTGLKNDLEQLLKRKRQ